MYLQIEDRASLSIYSMCIGPDELNERQLDLQLVERSL